MNVAAHYLFGQRRIQVGVSAPDGADRIDKFGRRALFENVTARTRTDQLFKKTVVRVAR